MMWYTNPGHDNRRVVVAPRRQPHGPGCQSHSKEQQSYQEQEISQDVDCDCLISHWKATSGRGKVFDGWGTWSVTFGNKLKLTTHLLSDSMTVQLALTQEVTTLLNPRSKQKHVWLVGRHSDCGKEAARHSSYTRAGQYSVIQVRISRTSVT